MHLVNIRHRNFDTNVLSCVIYSSSVSKYVRTKGAAFIKSKQDVILYNSRYGH